MRSDRLSYAPDDQNYIIEPPKRQPLRLLRPPIKTPYLRINHLCLPLVPRIGKNVRFATCHMPWAHLKLGANIILEYESQAQIHE